MTGLLSLLTWLPLIGAILVLFLPEKSAKAAKTMGLAFAGVSFLASLLMVTKFDSSSFAFQFTERIEWLPALGINYHLGVDGISLWLVVLSALLTIVALMYANYVEHRAKLFVALVLILETAMIGTFLSLDLILFYTFFELALVPMYFMISIWGGERRKYAAAKFFIYTFAGSIFMLVGMVTLAMLHQRAAGTWSFNILEIQSAVANGSLWTGAFQAQVLIFWSFAVAFLIKSPAFPFHTWIADTYAESPVAGPILSSAMVKMGSYGFLRFCIPLFPDVVADQLPILMALCVIGILYGAAVAAVQKDMRRMLAYSSLSHMGFVLLGIVSLNLTGMVGGAYQQLNHGITASALFLLVGFLIQRRGSADLDSYGGLKSQMPTFATLFLISMLASVGLPGLNGFVGEFLAMTGAFTSGYAGLGHLTPIYVILAAGGVVLAAVYLLYLYQRIFYGEVTGLNARLKDLKRWEVATVGALVVLMIWGGVYPSTFTKPMEASLSATQAMAVKPAGDRPAWASPTTTTVVAKSE